jgi:hypothetical protein
LGIVPANARRKKKKGKDKRRQPQDFRGTMPRLILTGVVLAVSVTSHHTCVARG